MKKKNAAFDKEKVKGSLSILLMICMMIGLGGGGVTIYGKSLSNKTIKQYQKALRVISENYDRLLAGKKFTSKEFPDENYKSIAARIKGLTDGDYHPLYASYHDLNNDGLKECIVSAKINNKLAPLGILTYKNKKVKVVRLINKTAFTGNYEMTIHKNRIYEFYNGEGSSYYNIGKMNKKGTYKGIANLKYVSAKKIKELKKHYATDISLKDHKIASKIQSWMAAYVNEIVHSHALYDYLKENPKMKTYLNNNRIKGEPLTYTLLSLDAKTPTLIVTNANAPHVTKATTWYAAYQYTNKGLKKVSSLGTHLYYHVGSKTCVLRNLETNKGSDQFIRVSKNSVTKLEKVTYKYKNHKMSGYKLNGKVISTSKYEALYKKVNVTCKNGKISNASSKKLCTFKRQIDANKYIYKLKK